MPRKRTKPKHVFGKSTGYTLNPDDSVTLCPMYRESMDNSIAEEAAIRQQLAIVTAILHERLTACEKARGTFWKRVSEDIGLDIQSKVFLYRDGVIYKKETSDDGGNQNAG